MGMRMNKEAGRFVDNDDLLVLVQNCEPWCTHGVSLTRLRNDSQAGGNDEEGVPLQAPRAPPRLR